MTDRKNQDSGVFEMQEYTPYIYALAGEGRDMDFRDRSNLMYLEKCLHAKWRLGENCILSWARFRDGILLLLVPHYAVAEYTAASVEEVTTEWRPSEQFIIELISGERRLDAQRLVKVAALLSIEPDFIQLKQALNGSEVETRIVEKMIRRYGISYLRNRAVALFDIVGFSLLSPFEQMAQLNSLSYSLNSAHSKMLDRELDINFARSSSGDGFYIWNRDPGIEANTNLYHFMHLVLADNAIARSKATSNAVPLLRTAFHVGSCYEFHQAEGLNPSIHDYIVGDVTIELARMIERGLPGQIFVGDFQVSATTSDGKRAKANWIDSIEFLDRAEESLLRLNGLSLSGEKISSIKCYLTGEQTGAGEFTIRKLRIADKHGKSRHVFNAKVNIYRESADPILLGIEDRALRQTPLVENTAQLLDYRHGH